MVVKRALGICEGRSNARDVNYNIMQNLPLLNLLDIFILCVGNIQTQSARGCQVFYQRTLGYIFHPITVLLD